MSESVRISLRVFQTASLRAPALARTSTTARDASRRRSIRRAWRHATTPLNQLLGNGLDARLFSGPLTARRSVR